ncbi:hypothetical protein [Streptomyces formicae]|uniref:Integral membrane protein n=1 Tax=Streptomyces formicae TaxID=1616117 RepID=A0ABY3WHR4_9ACTN|nr:hypothetical protein [Streptomyces formicae]UNM12124.1 hypothetical protein J4032_11755 [Streptomyces formicae]
MNITHARRLAARIAAAAYVTLIAAGGVAHGLAGGPESGPEGLFTTLYFASLPGSVLVIALVLLPLAAVAGGFDPDAQTGSPFGALAYLVGGALLNVGLAWGALRFVRLFVREARGAR